MQLPLMVVVWFTLAATGVFLLREIFRKPNAISVSYGAALESAKLIKDWGSWMTTVSTAVIGTNGFLLASAQTGIERQPMWSFLSVLMFGLSIVIAAWVLGSLPSVVSRLNDSTAGTWNDIYEMRFFSFVPIRVGVITGLQHVFFVLGLYCFALYVVGAPETVAL